MEKKIKKSEVSVRDNKDIEKEIVSLAQKGLSPSKIGIVLKQKHNIPKLKKISGDKITWILRKNNITYKRDIDDVKTKVEKLENHLKKNKHDYSAKRAMITLKGRVNKLRGYYSKKDSE